MPYKQTIKQEDEKMTPQDYIDAGYKVSTNTPQQLIDRAEAEIKRGYIKPLDADEADEKTKAAIMALSFLRLCQQQLFATPAGGRLKTNQFSQTPEQFAALNNQAAACYAALKDVPRGTNAGNEPMIDVCGIFFVSQYFYI